MGEVVRQQQETRKGFLSRQAAGRLRAAPSLV
jgi:hypothetical protein